MYKISDEVIKIIEETMKNWRMDLTTGGKKFNWSKISDLYLPGTYYQHYYLQ